MKITEERNKELGGYLAALHNKCYDIVGKIESKFKSFENQLVNDGLIEKWTLNQVRIVNPFNKETISLFGEDNNYYLNSDLTVIGFDNDVFGEFDGIVQFEIEEHLMYIEGEELDLAIEKYVHDIIDPIVERVKLNKIKRQEEDSERLKEVIKSMGKDKIIEILNKI